MKQLLQNLHNGDTEIIDVPAPEVKPGYLLVRTHHSLVSAGTERMLVEFGKANFINKARQQPDKVRMVIDKIKTDGLVPTLNAVKNKLDTPLPMGYCNVGEVITAGDGINDIAVGDYVVSNGSHAEIVLVPKNLCVRIPSTITNNSSATFSVLGAIALQGLRLAKPTLGEAFVVTGLGLIGLLAVQLLRAQGCRVLGMDYNPERLALAKQFGAEIVDLANNDPLAAAENFSRNRGVDGVLITATDSNDPVHQAALMCRKRARIILVGVAGLELSRADFYEKELTFQVSCSYGPGRYDKNYEERGHDYPIGYVRWTEQRNIEAVLDMIVEKKIDIAPLISHHFRFDEAASAYQLLSSKTPSLGILLNYAVDKQLDKNGLTKRTIFIKTQTPQAVSTVKVGFIGAGNYATQILIPAFKEAAITPIAISSQTGISAAHAAKKFSIPQATTDTNNLINNPDINTVVITTRHDTHAKIVCQALRAGKHVFVEKPLALNHADLDEIEKTYHAIQKIGDPKLLMVGFNRRFAPQISKIKKLLASSHGSKAFIMTVNAGAIPADHWTQDLKTGGGRIIGEACHFIDLLRFLANSPIASFQASKLGNTTSNDNATITLNFTDGSIGTIHYLANGHKSFPKERLEVFCAGRILQLNNFRKLSGYGWPNFKKINLWQQNKGQTECTTAFVAAIKNQAEAPIPFDELIEVARMSIQIAEFIQQCA